MARESRTLAIWSTGFSGILMVAANSSDSNSWKRRDLRKSKTDHFRGSLIIAP